MNTSLSDQLAITAGKTGEIGLTADIAEFAIDQLLEPSVLKDIPVVGWIAKGLEVCQTISDRILFNKILRFLSRLESIGSDCKSAFQIRVSGDADFRRRVGEHLLTFLDRLDDLKKTEILASCFDHFLTGDIDHDHFVELAAVIDRLTSRDLAEIARPRNQRLAFPSIGRAVASGILEYGIKDPESSGEPPTIGTRLTRIGIDLRDISLAEFRGRDECRARSEQEQQEQLTRMFTSLLEKNKP